MEATEIDRMYSESESSRPESAPLTGAEEPDHGLSLFLVECRLPTISKRDLAMLQAALIGASRRFASRGEHVRYLRSTFVPRQQRLLSLFAGGSIELVRAANEAALVPYLTIEPAFDLPYPSDTTAE